MQAVDSSWLPTRFQYMRERTFSCESSIIFMMKSLSLLSKHAAYKTMKEWMKPTRSLQYRILHRAADFGECGEGECLKLDNFGRKWNVAQLYSKARHTSMWVTSSPHFATQQHHNNHNKNKPPSIESMFMYTWNEKKEKERKNYNDNDLETLWLIFRST